MPSTTHSSSGTPAAAASRAAQMTTASEKPTRATPATKPAAAEAAAGKPASRSVAPKKSAAKKKASSFEAPAEAEWHRLISEAAYYRAEKRGFAAGHEDEDWVWAEEQVRKVLSP